MKTKLLGVIAASLLSIATAPTLRAATFLYDVDIVRPVTFPGFTGPSPDFVQGTITTDCNNCVMVKSDIVDWNFIIATHGGFSDTLLGPLSGNNSFILFGGNNQMVATPRGLFFSFVSGSTLTFDDVATNGGTTLQLFQASNGLPIIGWETAGGTGAFINPTSDLIGTAVPEPSTWAMMLIGFAGLGFAAYRRKSLIASAAR